MAHGIRGIGRGGGSSELVVVGQTGLGAQCREEDHLADRVDLGQQHDQAIDPHPHPARRRHPVLEGTHVVEIDITRFRVAGGLGLGLLPEAGELLHGVVQLAVGVGQLAPGDDHLEPLDQGRVVTVGLGQRGRLSRVVDGRSIGPSTWVSTSSS